MKKLYYILTLTFITLLAACSQEDVVNKEPEDNRVNISAELPADIAITRTQISVPSTHKLRCIIEVWTKSTTPTLKYRQEVAVEGGTLPTFDFALRPGDYTCLMWADFIAKDAASTEETAGGITYTHFADTYYDTSDLHAVSIKEGATDKLFDTDLCDGFYASLEIKKNATAVQQTMKMKRPFAKLIVKEKDESKFASLNGMAVECQLPKEFSVATGEPAAKMLTAVYDKTFQSGDDPQVLFTAYVFVPSTGLPMGNFLLSFDTDADKSKCEIPAESITLKRNQQLVASGKLMEGGMLEPEPGPEPGADPQIGDYFFIDGTWSSELTEENKDNCVGIVYAVGTQPGDNIDYYPNSSGKSIKGYVMALKNLNTQGMGIINNVHAISGRPYFYLHAEKEVNGKLKGVLVSSISLYPSTTPDKTNFTGCSKTKELLEHNLFQKHQEDWNYPALQVFSKWKKGTAPVVQNSSGWYIPSVAQLYAAAGGCYGVEAKSGYPAIEKKAALNEAFTAAIDNGIAEAFTGNTGKGYYVYTSCLNSQTTPGPCLVQINKDGTAITPKEHPADGAQGIIRPVLTIIK